MWTGARSAGRYGCEMDQAIVEQGLKLTALAMGTAFASLLLLMLAIAVVGRLVAAGSRGDSRQAETPPGEPAPDDRDRALAAVVAVSAVFERRDGPAVAGGAVAEAFARE